MYPVLIDWGFIYIPSWHFFYVLGALASYGLMLHLAKRFEPSIPLETFPGLFVVCYISGYLGARGLSILIEQPLASSAPVGLVDQVGYFFDMLTTWGPMTFYGGAIFSGLCGVIYLAVRKQSIPKVLDLAVPSGFLALAIGRMGCFLNGDDYGVPVHLEVGQPAPFWAVIFPNLGDQTPRWPVQLIELALVGISLVLIIASFKSLRASFRSGIVAYVTLVAYANIRLFNEFLRDDFRGSILTSWLSTSQFISLVILMVALLISPVMLRKSASY